MAEMAYGYGEALLAKEAADKAAKVQEDQMASMRAARGDKSRKPMRADLPVFEIKPTGVYAPLTLARGLGCTELTIRKAIARKRLKASRAVAQRHLVLGDWVLEWLEDDWKRRQRQAKEAA